MFLMFCHKNLWFNSFYGERYFPLPKALTSKSNKWDLDMIPIVLLLPCWMWQMNRKVESKCTLQNSRAVLYFLLFWGKSTKIDPNCKEICPSGPDCFISWRWTLSWRPVFSQGETPEQTEILVRDERPFVSLIHPQNSLSINTSRMWTHWIAICSLFDVASCLA